MGYFQDFGQWFSALLLFRITSRVLKILILWPHQTKVCGGAVWMLGFLNSQMILKHSQGGKLGTSFAGLEKEMAVHSSVLAWRILWIEEPGGLLSMGLHRVRHDWSDLAGMHALEKEKATHSSILAWRIPGTEEPGGLPFMGSHRVGHNWNDLAAAAAVCGFCHIWLQHKNKSKVMFSM